MINKETMAIIGSLVLHLALFGFLTFTVSLPIDIGSKILDVQVFETHSSNPGRAQVKSSTREIKKQSDFVQPNSIKITKTEDQKISEKKSADDTTKSTTQDSDVDSGSVYEATSRRLTRLPKILHEQKVEYPPVAKANGIQGTVTMRVVIDETGSIKNVEVLSGPGYGLNESAAAALKGFVFSPAYIDNRAVSVRFIYKYNFQIQ